MKTVLVTTTYLIPQERYDKTIKFLDYYLKKTNYDILVLDNHSSANSSETLNDLRKHYANEQRISIISYTNHYDRPAWHDYKYLWRAVHHLQHLFPAYDKVVYMDNDFYMISPKMFDYVDKLNSGWTTFWAPRYKFPETGCHVLIKGCKNYDDFVNMPMEDFIQKNNLTLMETRLPVTLVNKDLVGDRYPERETIPTSYDGIDFWAQARLEDKFE